MSYIRARQADGTIVKVPLGGSVKGAVRYDQTQVLTEAQKSQTRSNIGAISDNITLGIHSDGLVYIFVDGQPMGEGISMSAASEIYGYVADDGTIVVKGDLADGEYTVKYEIDNEDGTVTTIDIGDLVLDNTVYYSITKNLTNCTLSNSATQVAEGESFGAAITANDGYELTSVVVTMGGNAVGVSSGVIGIPSVTGDIVITAVATEAAEPEPVTENITLTKDMAIVVGTGVDRANTTGYCATPHIDVSTIPKPCTIHLTGARWTFTNAGDSGYIRFYIADKSGTKLASDYTHSSKMPSGVTLATNGGDETDVTVTITSDNIGTLRFAGYYTYGNLVNTNASMAQTKATLTYTPNS